MFENGKVANHVFRYAIESEYLRRQRKRIEKKQPAPNVLSTEKSAVEMVFFLQWNDRDVWSN